MRLAKNGINDVAPVVRADGTWKILTVRIQGGNPIETGEIADDQVDGQTISSMDRSIESNAPNNSCALSVLSQLVFTWCCVGGVQQHFAGSAHIYHERV